MVRKGFLGRRARKVWLDLQDHLDRLDCREIVVSWETVDLLVYEVIEERKDLLVTKGLWAIKVSGDRKGLWARRARKV